LIFTQIPLKICYVHLLDMSTSLVPASLYLTNRGNIRMHTAVDRDSGDVDDG
jgi:hypothetical protein